LVFNFGGNILYPYKIRSGPITSQLIKTLVQKKIKMDLSIVSIEQLKRWLSVLKLSTAGTWRQLILRLNNIPKEVRGKFEEMARQKGDKDGENSKGKDSGDNNFEDDGGTIQKEGGDKSNSKGRDKSNGKDGGIQSYNEEDGETNAKMVKGMTKLLAVFSELETSGTKTIQKTTCTTRLERILGTQEQRT